MAQLRRSLEPRVHREKVEEMLTPVSRAESSHTFHREVTSAVHSTTTVLQLAVPGVTCLVKDNLPSVVFNVN
jgi:hypothetical protein